MDEPLRGSCLCGGVRFEVTAPFRRANHCHCSRCRKHSGTFGLTQGRVPREGFRLVAGEALIRVYRPDGVVHHVGSVSTGGPQSPDVQRLAGRNRLLCLARNAPLTVVRQQMTATREHRRAAVRLLPAALWARARMSRRWTRSPAEVWERWAGADNTWPTTA